MPKKQDSKQEEASKLIKEGLRTGDLELVKKGRDLLKEDEPKKKKDDLDFTFQIKQNSDSSGRTREGGKTLCKRKPFNKKKTKINFFKDKGEAKDPTEKKLYVKPPTDRSRKNPLKKMRCCRCNREEYVNPAHIRRGINGQPTYTCNNCISSYRPSE